ncbi:tetratricopeptide repeat protein [Luteolibacter soli]|uniref:Tetratricopeptide repeat protein n=1 Tax=Luteolibacter soli TaxID=3135280 RepID=A0ABU9B127_9BACT
MKRRVLVLAPLLLACGPFFYQAPPPLESYPQRIPGKGWRDIFAETKPAPADAASSLQLIDACEALVEELPKLTPAERLSKIDALLTRNREGDFRLRTSNLLLELRELAADDATLGSASSYLKWRLERLGDPAGLIVRAPVKNWDMSDADFQAATRDYNKNQAAASEWLDHEMAAGPAVLHPNLMVQIGALAMDYGDYTKARNTFTGMIGLFPDHPRTEPARLMLGRCLLELAKAESKKPQLTREEQDGIDELLKEATQEFESCVNSGGRFAADASGWLAAVALQHHNFNEALRRQLARLDLQPTREVTRSVLRECDRIFTEVFQGDRGFEYAYDEDGRVSYWPFELMAKHPAVARLFVGHALDPEALEALPAANENFESDRDTLDFLHRRIIRPQPLARRSLTELGAAIVQSGGVSKPDALTLLILGWASYREGEVEQALALFDQAQALQPGEEIIQGRALALTALGRHREAADAYAALASKFPESPITKNSAFDHAIARFHAGEAGEALLMLYAMQPEGTYLPTAPLHPEHEPSQWIDSIAQFAPLDQLAAPLARLPEGDPQTRLLRTIVRSRALAAENFNLARRYLDPAGDTNDEKRYGFGELPRGIGLTAAIWQQEVESLAGATELLDQAPADQKARKHLQIARRWKELRGRLTLPLHDLFDYSQSENEKLEQLRRKNASFLGFKPEAVTAELDSRDELHHALRHFLAAADSSDPDVAAPALEEANDALFRLAEFSLYRCSRAAETDATGLSRKLVERLRKDFPDSPEAIRAVRWTFTPPALLGRWMPGDYSPSNSAEEIRSNALDPKLGRWREWRPDPGTDEGKRLQKDFANLIAAPDRDMTAIRKGLADFRADFNRTRHLLDEGDVLALVDDLDDLTAAAQVPAITPDLFGRYATLRRGKTTPPPAAGEWAPLAPWLAFLDRVRPVQVEDNGHTELSDDTVESWERYLRDFPNGPKSEAASLRLLRLKVRAAYPVPQVEAFFFPDSPIPRGYKRLKPAPEADQATMRALAKELDAHEKRFPGGRCHSDILVLQAAVAAQSHNYQVALKSLAEVIADPLHPELRMNAALYFSEISLRLLDKTERPAVAAAFRSEHSAMPLLKNLVHGDTCLFRLRPLMAWLEES